MVTQQDIIEFQIREAKRKLSAVHARSKGKITAAGRQAQAELNRLLKMAESGSAISARGLRDTYATSRNAGRMESASLAADLARQGGDTSAIQAMAAQQEGLLGAQGNRTGAYQSDLDTLLSGMMADRDRGARDVTAATQQELDANLAEQMAALDAERQLALMNAAARGGGGGGFGRGGGGTSGDIKPLTASELRQLNDAFAKSRQAPVNTDKLLKEYVYDAMDKSISADPAKAALGGDLPEGTGRGFAPTNSQGTDIAREQMAMRIRQNEQDVVNDIKRRIAAHDYKDPTDLVRGWNITQERLRADPNLGGFNLGDVSSFIEDWATKQKGYDQWAKAAPTLDEFMHARIAQYYAGQGAPGITDEDLDPTKFRLGRERLWTDTAEGNKKKQLARNAAYHAAVQARNVRNETNASDWLRAAQNKYGVQLPSARPTYNEDNNLFDTIAAEAARSRGPVTNQRTGTIFPRIVAPAPAAAPGPNYAARPVTPGGPSFADILKFYEMSMAGQKNTTTERPRMMNRGGGRSFR